MTQEIIYDSVVIGGGQSGLASAWFLQREGLDFVVLEQSGNLGSWAHYYDSLQLFSPARYSSLPGYPFPGDPEKYPSRDEVVQYLRAYADHFQFPVRYHTRVERVEKKGELFRLTTAGQEILQTRSVLCASGPFRKPYLPSLPGMKQFQGAVLHSLHYHHAEEYRDRSIAVVGAGNSAVQIAYELAQLAEVTLATRRPVQFTPQVFLGRDIHYWTHLLRLDQSRLGKWLLQRRSSGVLDTGRYKAAIEAKTLRQRPMFQSFGERGVYWEDGSYEDLDTVIFATGFVPSFPYLIDPGVLDESGSPIHKHGISLNCKGLYFVGLPWQSSLASATIRGAGPDAKTVVQELLLHLNVAPSPFQKRSCCQSGRKTPLRL
ncbi:flavin-containing monooxygenase [Paenibacillus mucilaginosus]|uniref:Monooxygenase n=1 Tax=Paenibacillus mucilaginosus (strain KNP414) TaxID=1036673 RepID=F8F662_PAEMK|nr:NAD(P)/FAD-dependent oxidoreductase [Paenibacillus mucilaginosus]AEI41950.1 hypothetical protein KNP414_03392 [Paenibacillus mucilaginosus KNP414]MCG7218099.1 NAD(P)/FAD-dependent oxidoreductase [Paenibacillus mucilaginosus]WDM28857.1 NAD(P)/FAD-dependent oxidoreductase [Paenibacillus mucilaginosus]